MEKMDVWSTEKDFGQVPANNLDSPSRISRNIFQVHSSYTELTKKMMNYFLQMMNFFICLGIAPYIFGNRKIKLVPIPSILST